MSIPKALIVDFGGVMTTPLLDSFVAFAEANGIELQDLVRVALRAYADENADPLVVAFETGRVEEAEFAIEFAQRLAQETGVEVDPERLVRRMFGALRLEEAMFEAVAAIRAAGNKTALLSNSWGLADYPRERLAEIMDVIVISAEVGLRKPMPEIFDMTTEKLGVAAAECVFVDDHPGHLKVARSLGWITVLHHTVPDTLAELERLFGVALVSGN
ncbi:MAG: HAD family phosphatase [Actinomycetota bacterium]|nr:HAD family phosphatase [Actinomycetota bacterium]